LQAWCLKQQSWSQRQIAEALGISEEAVSQRNVCGFNLPHLRHELRDAVTPVRRQARLLKSLFRGAKL
jgi:predicted XRE-type DNA-binding protein